VPDPCSTGEPEFIVAEIVKTWPQTSPGLLCHRFEDVIEVNRRRGYELHAFTLSQLMTDPGTLTETIIAVFRRKS
jgi:hypothetical protein